MWFDFLFLSCILKKFITSISSLMSQFHLKVKPTNLKKNENEIIIFYLSIYQSSSVYSENWEF